MDLKFTFYQYIFTYCTYIQPLNKSRHLGLSSTNKSVAFNCPLSFIQTEGQTDVVRPPAKPDICLKLSLIKWC